MVYSLETLSPAELEARIAAKPVLLLPFGNIEWHSAHLPLGVDALKAQALCESIAERTGGVLGPPSYWAAGAVPLPYTIHFELDLIERLAHAAFLQFAAMGFRVLLGVTGHYALEQLLVLKRAALAAMQQSPVTIFVGGEYEVVSELGFHGDHAAQWETSLMLAAHPALVHLERLQEASAANGILGQDPRTSASQALGTSTYETIVERLGRLSERFLNQTTPVQRAQYIEALTAGVRVLEKIMAERAVKPKARVAPLVTRAYQDYLQAIWHGEYLLAKQCAEAKWFDPDA